MIRNTLDSYGSITKFLHWLIFLLLFVMICIGFVMDELPKDYQGTVYNIHKLTGLSILVLMVLRMFWSWMNVKPMLPFAAKPWEKAAERLVHFLLYIVVIAMPIAGWVGSSAGGKYPHIGDWKLVLPIEQSKTIAGVSFDFHTALAYTLIVLFVIHFAAALFHHYIRKDNVLLRMLPGKRQR